MIKKSATTTDGIGLNTFGFGFSDITNDLRLTTVYTTGKRFSVKLPDGDYNYVERSRKAVEG